MTSVARRLADDWATAAPARKLGFVVVVCATVFALVNWRNVTADFIPLALESVAMLQEGTVRLDSYRRYAERPDIEGEGAFTESGGHLYPVKPLFVSVLAVPFYLPPVLAGVPTEAVEFWLGYGRLVAAVLAAVAVGVCGLTARRWVGGPAALGLSLLLAFGTCVWTVWGQALNYHLGAGLCVAGLVYLLRDFPLSPGRAFAVGFLAGAAVGMRPTTVVLLAPVGGYLLLPGRLAGTRSLFGAVVGAAVVPGCNALLNRWAFGGWLATGYAPGTVEQWTTPVWEGAFGQLLAPNSGLWVQSPFTLLAVVGTWAVWRPASTVPDRGLLRACSLGFAAYWLLFARWHDWQGGLGFAARMLSEGFPMWLPLVAVGWAEVRPYRPARWAAGAAAGWSVAYQLVGVALFDAVSAYNPPHDPWNPGRHFYALFIRKFGIAATVQAVGVTAGQFVAAAAAAAYVADRVFLAGRRPHSGLRGPKALL